MRVRLVIVYALLALALFGCGAESEEQDAVAVAVEPTEAAASVLTPTNPRAIQVAPTGEPIEVALGPTPTFMPEPAEPVALGSGGLPWWNDRVFYEIFVRSFADSDGDGIGDIQGIIERLDYLNDGDPTTTDDLGITGIWLMPVTESPSYHGYDVIDYRAIEQDYGTAEDFKQLVEEAHERGIAVIVDLVLNHTSSRHPWFIEAKTRGSEYDDWYIWSPERLSYTSPWGTTVWFGAGDRYYYSVFCDCMADLNYRNPEVTEAMYEIIRFWLEEMEVDGFRLDAIKHIVEDGPIQENTVETHAWLEGFHRFVRAVDPHALTVGEAWTSTEEVVEYIGDEVDIAFEFDLAGAMIEAAREGRALPMVVVQRKVLRAYPEGQYATFLANHDMERVLTQLDEDFGANKVAASLLLTQPGVPFIYYGEEIGIRGQKPDERIRTPMQWDDTAVTAGFSTRSPWQALAPGYRERNVALMTDDPDSLLSHYRRLIHLRNEHPALRTGDFYFVDSAEARSVYSFLRHSEEETLLVVINLGREAVSDYRLSLEEGPLEALSEAELLLGQGEIVAPSLQPGGGFGGYMPVPVLAPQSTTIIKLRR